MNDIINSPEDLAALVGTPKYSLRQALINGAKVIGVATPKTPEQLAKEASDAVEKTADDTRRDAILAALAAFAASLDTPPTTLALAIAEIVKLRKIVFFLLKRELKR